MRHPNSAVETLRFEIATLEAQLTHLRTQLAEAESSDASKIVPNPSESVSCCADNEPAPPVAPEQTCEWGWPLDADDYKRYGRQMIMPEIGLKGWFCTNNRGEVRETEL